MTHVSTVLVVLKVVGPSMRTLGESTSDVVARPAIGSANPRDETTEDNCITKRTIEYGESIARTGAE